MVRLRHPAPLRPALSAGTITITATPAMLNFTLVSHAVSANTPAVTIMTSAAGLQLLSSVSLNGFFAFKSALASTAGDSVPTPEIFGQCSTGSPTAFTAFTQSTPTAGASLLIWTTSSTVAVTAGRTDVLTMRIDLTNSPQLPAGNYSGTLTLQVQAF